MREILFRGKLSGVGDRWAYGLLIEQNEVTNTILEHGWSKCLVIPESVGQFTGLYDKNNVRIFEGDITYYDFGINVPVLMKVVFNEGEFRLRPIGQYDFNVWEIRICNEEKNIEVIGNIFDNIELLKEE